jgi:hypothetical protein
MTRWVIDQILVQPALDEGGGRHRAGPQGNGQIKVDGTKVAYVL